jgi:hypothetical protein
MAGIFSLSIVFLSKNELQHGMRANFLRPDAVRRPVALLFLEAG